jgi:hypothetical protein
LHLIAYRATQSPQKWFDKERGVEKIADAGLYMARFLQSLYDLDSHFLPHSLFAAGRQKTT